MGECLIMRRAGESYKPPVLYASYPQDVSTTVISGNTTSATFSVVISEAGNPPEYTYQWYVDEIAVDGATSSSYTKSDLTDSAVHKIYCAVSNSAGTAISRTATLTVEQYYTPTLDSTYPANASVAIKTSVTSKVVISKDGNPAEYTYQWYKNGSIVSGETGSSYTFSPTTVGTTTVYCKVTNVAGTVTSRTATITATTLYLFNSGSKNETVTGGWYTPSTSSSSLSGTVSTLSSFGGHSYTKNQIDLTGLSTLKVKLTSVTGQCTIAICSSKTPSKTSSLKSYKSATASSTVSLDISSISGKYYIVIMAGASGSVSTCKYTATQVWLE